jgi:hypothetical protein
MGFGLRTVGGRGGAGHTHILPTHTHSEHPSPGLYAQQSNTSIDQNVLTLKSIDYDPVTNMYTIVSAVMLRRTRVYVLKVDASKTRFDSRDGLLTYTYDTDVGGRMVQK